MKDHASTVELLATTTVLYTLTVACRARLSDGSVHLLLLRETGEPKQETRAIRARALNPKGVAPCKGT